MSDEGYTEPSRICEILIEDLGIVLCSRNQGKMCTLFNSGARHFTERKRVCRLVTVSVLGWTQILYEPLKGLVIQSRLTFGCRSSPRALVGRGPLSKSGPDPVVLNARVSPDLLLGPPCPTQSRDGKQWTHWHPSARGSRANKDEGHGIYSRPATMFWVADIGSKPLSFYKSKAKREKIRCTGPGVKVLDSLPLLQGFEGTD